MSEGKELIKYFCYPCKLTKVNGGRVRNYPQDAPEKWELFKTYCVRDVDVEKQIHSKLIQFPISEQEQKCYCLDQRINDRGIMVERNPVEHAITCIPLLYYEDKFVYNHHATDPACGKLPSFQAMQEFASKEERVKMTLINEKENSAKLEFTADTDWRMSLEYTKTGIIVYHSSVSLQ